MHLLTALVHCASLVQAGLSALGCIDAVQPHSNLGGAGCGHLHWCQASAQLECMSKRETGLDKLATPQEGRFIAAAASAKREPHPHVECVAIYDLCVSIYGGRRLGLRAEKDNRAQYPGEAYPR